MFRPSKRKLDGAGSPLASAAVSTRIRICACPRSFKMMLADRAHERRLWSLVSDGFGKSHLLPDLETVEAPFGNAIAMEVDLASVGRGNEPMIVLGRERADDAVRGRLVGFDVALSLAHEILELAARGGGGVRDRDLHVLVAPGGRRIAADGDIRGAWDREGVPNTVRHAPVMAG